MYFVSLVRSSFLLYEVHLLSSVWSSNRSVVDRIFVSSLMPWPLLCCRCMLEFIIVTAVTRSGKKTVAETVMEHVKKLAFFASASAKGGGSTPPHHRKNRQVLYVHILYSWRKHYEGNFSLTPMTAFVTTNLSFLSTNWQSLSHKRLTRALITQPAIHHVSF